MLEQLRIYEYKFPELIQAVIDEIQNHYELIDMEYHLKISKGTEKLVIELKKGSDHVCLKQFCWNGVKQGVNRYKKTTAAA